MITQFIFLEFGVLEVVFLKQCSTVAACVRWIEYFIDVYIFTILLKNFSRSILDWFTYRLIVVIILLIVMSMGFKRGSFWANRRWLKTSNQSILFYSGQIQDFMKFIVYFGTLGYFGKFIPYFSTYCFLFSSVIASIP